MKKLLFLSLFILFLILSGCSEPKVQTWYQPFPGGIWKRFDPVKFNIPVVVDEMNCEVIFFARFVKGYEYPNFDFHMIMNTSSGEERIKEYHMTVKGKNGQMTGQWNHDTCEIQVILKKELQLTKGMLTIEIENLIPRIETAKIAGAGIRLRKI
ncbi:MAG: hypothetical protein WCL00_00890 [Bacteroidota bacterium]